MEDVSSKHRNGKRRRVAGRGTRKEERHGREEGRMNKNVKESEGRRKDGIRKWTMHAKYKRK